MPTFFDSTADAAEASEALRGLAYASRGFDLSWVKRLSALSWLV